mgnify:CR=1 FL=1
MYRKELLKGSTETILLALLVDGPMYGYQLVEEMDARITRINCITGGHSTGAMVPLDYETDREILDVALVSIGLTEPPDAQLLWARNTLDVAEIVCSDTYLQEAQERDDLEVLSEPQPMPFDEDGNLPQIAELE